MAVPRQHPQATAPGSQQARLADPSETASDGWVASIRRHASRASEARRQGEPSFGRYLAQVGVLGWTIVIPALLGMFAGRWLDRRFNTGIFWTAPGLVLGVAVGCWGAWRWMHRP